MDDPLQVFGEEEPEGAEGDESDEDMASALEDLEDPEEITFEAGWIDKKLS